MFRSYLLAFTLVLVCFILTSVGITFISRKIYDITVLSFISYFLITAFVFRLFFKKIALSKLLGIASLALLLMNSITIYFWIKTDLYGVPAVLACYFAIIAGYSVLKFRTLGGLIIPLLGCLFVGYMYFQGWDYWLHKINFGTFTGRTNNYYPLTKFEATDRFGNLITENELKGKIVLLDFWMTSCAVCFEKFPQLEDVFAKYESDSSIFTPAINSPIEEDRPEQAFEEISNRGYKFPVLKAVEEDFAEKFGVRYYPTTFVINRNGMIVYKGGIEGAVRLVDELSRSSSE